MEPFVTIEVPGPPQGWERTGATIRQAYRSVRYGGQTLVVKKPFIKHYTRAATRSYEELLGIQGNLAMRGRKRLDEVPVKVEMLSIFAVPESWTKAEEAAALAGEIRPICKPDWDNIAKVTDGLNKIVWKDDAQIVDGRVQKFYGERSFLHIEVFV